jgi:hypothetical protein
VKAHPAVGITGLYLYICYIGSMYQRSLLGDFGIEYISFAEASDLFIAGFRNPIAVFGTTFLAVFVFTVLDWILERFVLPPGSRVNRWMIGGFLIFAALSGIFAPALEAGRESSRMSRGWGTYVRLDAPPDGARLELSEDGNFPLLGATNRFIFILHRPSKHAYAIPATAVRWMSLCRMPAPFEPGQEAGTLPPEMLYGKSCDP